MSEPITRREFLKKAGTAMAIAGFASLLSPFFKGPSKVEGRAGVGDLSHNANILETDNTLGVENAVAQFQVECKGQNLSTFVITEKNEYGIPRVFTDYNGKTVELLTWRTTEGDNSVRSWYIPGEDVPEGEKGIKGAVGMQDVLVYHSKADLNNGDRTIFYFPPDDKNSRAVGFDANNEIAYRFKASDLSSKVTSNLPS